MERKDVDKYTKIRKSISMNNLKKLIDKNNYTMVKFAMEVGLSDSTIYNYLNGDRLLSVVILVELAKKTKYNN